MKERTEYVVNIAGGALVGLVGVATTLALLSLPSVWVLIGGMFGAAILGIGGGLWVNWDLRRRQDSESDAAKTR
jgi:hypothetical protein